MSTYVRTTTVDSAPSGDSVKQAILDLDTDLTGHIAAYNTHDTATTSVHGFTGTKTGSGAIQMLFSILSMKVPVSIPLLMSSG